MDGLAVFPRVVRDQLSQNLNIPVVLEQYEWIEFMNKIKGENSGMFSLSWVADDYPDADSFLRVCMQTGSVSLAQ